MTILQPMTGLVALQFALYACGWLLAAALLPRQRTPAVHWAGFMSLVGLGFWLAGQRGEPRTWAAYCGSSLAFLSSYALLWRGVERFMDVRSRDLERIGMLLLVALALVLVGPGADSAAWRVLLTYGAGALLMARLLSALRGPMREQFGARTMHLIALPAYLMFTLMAARSAHQLLSWPQPLEMHQDNQRNLALMYAYLVGAALFNMSFIGLVMVRTVRWLQHLSMHDALTGLMNRRGLQAALEREWQRLQRHGTPFAVVALDLDHFKRVNDRHGHEAGDAVLVQTAEQLRQVARGADVVARSGGEEFVLLLSGVEADGAQAAAERLLQQVRAHAFHLRETVLSVTASAGVAQALPGDQEPGDVLRRADRALYQAKSEGRDRAVMRLAA